MLNRVALPADKIVHRIAYATLARAFDAAVREGVCQPSEVLLCATATISAPEAYELLFAASTNPDFSTAVRAYARFLEPDTIEDPGEVSAARTAERVIELSSRARCRRFAPRRSAAPNGTHDWSLPRRGRESARTN